MIYVLLKATVGVIATAQLTYSYDHMDIFPPNDEYDFEIFNPENLYGAPYGGFSRASSSRLAKLPLHLSDKTDFNFLRDDYDDGERNKKNTKSKESPHFNMRDYNGRQFTCRVYKEEELTPKSVASSMFDDAIEQDENSKIREGELTPLEIFKKNLAMDENEIPLMEVLQESILPKLEFDCVEYELGYWTYQWCDGSKVIQYHKDTEGETTISHTLGTYSRKTMYMKVESGTGKLAASLVHEFTDGDYCEASGKNRNIAIEVTCCSKYREPLEDIIKFTGIQEKDTCSYTGMVCTSLLCSDNILNERTIMAKNITVNNEEWENIQSFRDISIRKILSLTVGKRCLSKDAGWWNYEFCHTKFIRQFHARTVTDEKTRVTGFEIETEHSLGKYDERNDAYEDEEENNYVKNRKFVYTLDGPKRRDGAPNPVNGKTEMPTHAFLNSQYVDRNGNNGAAYVQEYINGDVCDEIDVTDAAIKGGTVVNGGIERSTTVRFSCGMFYELVSVDEDSTCHYIVEVTVPELCHHPSFLIHKGSTKVIKCLPVPKD